MSSDSNKRSHSESDESDASNKSFVFKRWHKIPKHSTPIHTCSSIDDEMEYVYTPSDSEESFLEGRDYIPCSLTPTVSDDGNNDEENDNKDEQYDSDDSDETNVDTNELIEYRKGSNSGNEADDEHSDPEPYSDEDYRKWCEKHNKL